MDMYVASNKTRTFVLGHVFDVRQLRDNNPTRAEQLRQAKGLQRRGGKITGMLVLVHAAPHQMCPELAGDILWAPCSVGVQCSRIHAPNMLSQRKLPSQPTLPSEEVGGSGMSQLSGT